MAEILMTDGINRKLTEIISSAKTHLVFISPYLKLSASMFENISQAAKSNVKITVLYGKGELKTPEKRLLQGIPNLELFFLSHLHAKCYFSESQMLITSMNLYEFSQINNKEMGISIDRFKDKELFDKAVKEADNLLKSSQAKSIHSISKPKEDNKMSVAKLFTSEAIQHGHCIRCDTRIAHDTKRPLCASCFSVWNQWGDPDYREDFCHTCGEEDDVSMREPQCNSCYSKNHAKQHYR